MPSANIGTSGNIISDDFIELLRSEGFSHPALQSENFQLPWFSERIQPNQEMSVAYDLLRERWEEIRMDVRDMEISTLRRKWLMPFFGLLGFNPVFQKKNQIVGSENEQMEFNLSHRGWEDRQAPIIHSVDWEQDLDKRIEKGKKGVNSPHDLLQRYLNVAEDLWGIVTNGRRLRILRDFHHSLTKGFIEIDLEGLFETGDISDFRALFRLTHASRFIPDENDLSPLEKFHKSSFETGVEVGRKLRDHVREAIETLANGFLDGELIEQLQNSDELSRQYYRGILQIIYRLLFLLYVEQKGWLPIRDQRYVESYSVSGLRDLSTDPKAITDEHFDLWEGLQITFSMVREGYDFGEFKIPAYGGLLFDTDDFRLIKKRHLKNSNLLRAIFKLCYFQRKGVLHKINYTHLQVDELGSVYESLLEFIPRVLKGDEEINGTSYRAGQFILDARGMTRKTTGSYYTDQRLVSALIESSLKKVIKDRLKTVEENYRDSPNLRQEKEKAILSIKVCDPAAGSGAFLVAAMEELGKTLAQLRIEDEYPTEQELLKAKREVLQSCIYGVDVNEMAVELCRVSLWIAAAMPDMPLTFLDDKIRCGNSLIGVPLPGQVDRARKKYQEQIREVVNAAKEFTVRDKQAHYIKKSLPIFPGWPEIIPESAFQPVSADDTTIANNVRERHKKQLKFCEKIFEMTELLFKETFYQTYTQISAKRQDTPPQVQEKAEAWKEWQKKEQESIPHRLADLWTASFFWHFKDEYPEAPTQMAFEALRDSHIINPDLNNEVHELTQKHHFFHWHLAFPEIFGENDSSGFDVVVGNPPWEKIKLEEQQFFAYKAPKITAAPNKAARQKMIKELSEKNLELYQEFLEAKHDAEALSKFLRNSGRFPLGSVGDINTYSLFAELSVNLIKRNGRAGIIIPTGIATDNSLKDFFVTLIEENKLVSLIGFINSKKIFPDIKDYIKFALTTFGFSKQQEFMFFLTEVDQMHDSKRKFTLNIDEFFLLNPNTRTCPVFRTGVDADLTKKIYKNSTILIDENKNYNPWNISFSTMFHMSNDSHLFLSSPSVDSVPLYEAKMIWHYDHRFATYENATPQNINEGNLPQFTTEMHSDPNHFVLPRYWVKKSEVENRLSDYKRKWLFAFRGIAATTNERTLISTFLPLVGVGNSAPIIKSGIDDPRLLCCLIAGFNNITLGYVGRQKAGGSNLNFFIIKQLPIFEPIVFSEKDIEFISERVLKLIYNSYDMKFFALDMDYKG